MNRPDIYVGILRAGPQAGPCVVPCKKLRADVFFHYYLFIFVFVFFPDPMGQLHPAHEAYIPNRTHTMPR